MDKVVIGTCSKCQGPVTVVGPHSYQCDDCGAEHGRDVVGEYGVVIGERKPKNLVYVATESDLSPCGIILSCKTPVGTYYIYKFDNGFCAARDDVIVKDVLNTVNAAIAAAQADYDRRCGECFE